MYFQVCSGRFPAQSVLSASSCGRRLRMDFRSAPSGLLHRCTVLLPENIDARVHAGFRLHKASE